MRRREGVRVSLICATRGEVGEISDPSLATPENLAQVREQELRAACDVLGIEDLFILGYRDSGMAGTPDNQHPQALNRANRHEVVGRIVEIIRQTKPQVIITFDPKGGYGHPDHIAVHEASSEAFSAAGDTARYSNQLSNGLEPHRPRKLYYFVFRRSMIRDFQAAMKAAGIELDFVDMDAESMGTPDEEITNVVDVGRYVERKEQAARCHRTQVGKGQFLERIPEALRVRLMSTENLVRAEPPFVPGQDAIEEGIFDDFEV